MGYQMCPTCRGQRFIEAPIISFRFLFGRVQLSPGFRRVCHQCQGRGSIPLTESSDQGWFDLEQPDGFQTTAAFAQFVAEPQSPALRGPKLSREVTTAN